MFSRIYSLIFLLLSAPLLAGAADLAKTVQVRGFSYETPISLYVRQGNEYTPFNLKPFAPNSAIQLKPEQGQLTFFVEKNQDAAGDKPASKKWLRVAQVPVQNQTSDLMLAFLPATAAAPDSDRYNVIVYDNDARSFPVEAIRIINLSPANIAAKIGENAFMVPPNETQVVTPALDDKRRIYTQLAAQTLTKEWRFLFKNPIYMPVQAKLTCLIAYSASVMAARGQPGNLNPDGTQAPQMVLIQWTDMVPAETSTKGK